MILRQLHEAPKSAPKPKNDEPDTLSPDVINDVTDDVALKFGLSIDQVGYCGPGLGTKLPGWVEINCKNMQPEEIELLIRIAPGVIKKAYKQHAGIDVSVALNKNSRLALGSLKEPKAHMLVNFDVKLA